VTKRLQDFGFFDEGRGEPVRALVRAGSNTVNLDGLPIEIVHGDLNDAESLHRAARGCSTVLHVAADYRLWAPDAAAMFRTNVDGSVRVVEAAAAAGVARVVYTSSVAVLGINADRTPADETTSVMRCLPSAASAGDRS